MLSDEWLSRYGLLENFNASVTRTRTGTRTGTGTGTGTWTTGVTAIALCTSCSRAKNDIAVIRKSKQGYVVFYVRFLIMNRLCSSRSWLALCLYIFSVLVQTVRTVYFQCFMCTNVETCMLNTVYCSRNSCD